MKSARLVATRRESEKHTSETRHSEKLRDESRRDGRLNVRNGKRGIRRNVPCEMWKTTVDRPVISGKTRVLKRVVRENLAVPLPKNVPRQLFFLLSSSWNSTLVRTLLLIGRGFDDAVSYRNSPLASDRVHENTCSRLENLSRSARGLVLLSGAVNLMIINEISESKRAERLRYHLLRTECAMNNCEEQGIYIRRN